MRSISTVGEATPKSRMSKRLLAAHDEPPVGRQRDHDRPSRAASRRGRDLAATPVAVGAPSGAAVAEVERHDRVAARVDPAEQLGVVQAVARAQLVDGDLQVGRRAGAGHDRPSTTSTSIDPGHTERRRSVIGPTEDRASTSTDGASGTTRSGARPGAARRLGARRGVEAARAAGAHRARWSALGGGASPATTPAGHAAQPPSASASRASSVPVAT